MSSTILYKQSYKSRGLPGTPGLNVAHLQYIATRPGVAKNPGCGFGLWGKLPHDSFIQNQKDLEGAKQLIREVSGNATVYRVILSVGKDVAAEHDLHDRDNWERLINTHVTQIAKEMDISPENFCWLASMHQKENHPHVHLMFWDNGSDPRQEFMAPGVFAEKAERIRAAFAGDLNKEKIREAQRERRELSKEMRSILGSCLLDSNPARGLDLDRLENAPELEIVSQQLEQLLKDLPARGSLRFAYLQADYKRQVLELVDSCLAYPRLFKELERFEAAVKRTAEMYGNGEKTVARNVAAEVGKLRQALGNTVMDSLSEMAEELRREAAAQPDQVMIFARQTVRELGLADPDKGEYLSWNDARIKADALLEDTRLRLRLQGYALQDAGIDFDRLPRAGKEKTEGQRFLCGRVLSEEQWQQYRRAYNAGRQGIKNIIYDYYGYPQKTEASEETVSQRAALFAAVPGTVQQIPAYQILLASLPKERIPTEQMFKLPGFREGLRTVAGELLKGEALRLPFERHVAAAVSSLPLWEDRNRNNVSDEVEAADGNANGIDDVVEWENERQAEYRSAYEQERRALEQEILKILRRDAGWQAEQMHSCAGTLMLNIFRVLSQNAGQQNARAAHAPLHRSRDRSREQRRDERAKRQLGSDWEPEIE